MVVYNTCIHLWWLSGLVFVIGRWAMAMCIVHTGA